MGVQSTHADSLVLGSAFQEAYSNLGPNDSLVNELLEGYKQKRREIKKGLDGRRYGAYNAYRSTHSLS